MKKYLVEFIGTFFLVLVISLSGGNPLAIGPLLIAMVYMGGYISGAHYNPAVTLAVMMRGKIDRETAKRYMLAQVLGAVLGALVYLVINGKTFVPAPAQGIGLVPVFLVEMLFTCALALTVLHTATASKVKDNHYYGLAIGAILMAGIWAGAGVSGAVFNPAVALGTIIVDLGRLNLNAYNLIIYVVAELAGGALAAIIFKLTAPDLK